MKTLNRITPFALFLVLSIFLVGTALAAPNLVKMPGAAPNFEDPVSRETDPIHIGDAGNDYLIKVMGQPGATVESRNPRLPLPTSWDGYVFGLGANPLNNPTTPLWPDMQNEKMPWGEPVAGEDALVFRVPKSNFTDGLEFRLNVPGCKPGDQFKHATWKDGRAPYWLYIVGWQAAKGDRGYIYTEMPDGNHNGYGLVKQGQYFYPCGTGRIGPPPVHMNKAD